MYGVDVVDDVRRCRYQSIDGSRNVDKMMKTHHLDGVYHHTEHENRRIVVAELHEDDEDDDDEEEDDHDIDDHNHHDMVVLVHYDDDDHNPRIRHRRHCEDDIRWRRNFLLQAIH
jgi:hypothetical protein